jgi:hypothetical protein
VVCTRMGGLKKKLRIEVIPSAGREENVKHNTQ